MSDNDQAASDNDQAASDNDQAASDADQRASDLEQAAADRELEAHPPADPDRARVQEEAKAFRKQGKTARMASTASRSRGAVERHEQGRQRDSTALDRDQTAVARDRADARTATEVMRAAAAAARASAAERRESAAEARDVAAGEREQVTSEIERTMMDEPSGAYGRQIGEVLLGQEIARAQDAETSLAVGVVRLGEIKQIEKRRNGGGPARTSRERDLFLALQARLRPYDPIVRWSETDFVCALLAEDSDDARRRLEEACADLVEGYPGASADIGLATLADDDAPDSLVARARAACRQAS